MGLGRSAAAVLLAALLILVSVRLGAASYLREGFFTTGDQSYDQIAENIRAGHWFTVRGQAYVDNPPVYPLAVAGAYTLFGRGWQSVAVLQALLDVASALLLFALARRLFGTTAALVAVAGFAVYPYLVGQAALLMDTTLFTTLFLATALALVRTVESHRVVDAALLGGALGLGLLVRPTIAVVALAVPLAFLAVRLGWRRSAALTGVAAGVALLVIAPWTIRTYAAYDAFVLGAAKGGINFWKGNSPHAADYIEQGISVDLLTERSDTPEPPPGLDPVEADRWWFDQGRDWARDHPGAWLHGLRVKFEAFWSPQLNPNTSGDGAAKELAYTLSYSVILALACLALVIVHGARARRGMLIILTIALAFTVAHVLTVGYTRVRAPLDPLLLALAAAAGVELVRRAGGLRDVESR
jgi:4-amino-4-deoxy-L-arabinose transferase-like glycosyltransferase